MYLARNNSTNPNGLAEARYMLRESRRREGVLYSYDLADLGPDPTQHIVYEDGGSFRVDESVLERLRKQGVDTTGDELEDILFPFVDPDVRHRLEPFRQRQRYRSWRPAGDNLCRRVLEETHIMDRRRLCFLRLGRAVNESLDKKPALYIPLLDKSRDEIEQMIWRQESALRLREVASYLFAIFDLGRFFKESYARSIPQALDRDRLDELFLQEICGLNRDEVFWRGFFRASSALPTYLVRYLIMYFDAPHSAPFSARSFAGSHRFRHTRPTGLGQTMTRIMAMAIFELDSEALARLGRKDLVRLYRQKARECHPDQGGNPENFIRLTAAYEELLPSLR